MIPISGYGQQLFVLEEVSRDDINLTRAVSFDISDREVFLAELINLFTDAGYLHISIDSLVNLNGGFAAYYQKGNRTVVRDLFLISQLDSTRIPFNRHYSRTELETEIVNQLTSYQNKGYPFVELTITKIIKGKEDTVDIILMLETGPSVEITGLTFRGNRQLSNNYLQRLSGFDEPVIYSNYITQIFARNLRRSSFIDSIGEVHLTSTYAGYQLMVEVTEIRPSFLDIIMGYDPNASSGDQIVGNGRLTLNNLITEGSIAQLHFNKLPGTETRLLIGYHQKWLNSWPIDNTIGFDFHQRDSTYYQISGRFDVSYMVNRSLNSGLFLRFNTVEGSSVNQTIEYLESRSISYGFTIKYEDLDRYYVPQNGSTFYVELGNILKNLKNIPESSLYNSSYYSQYIHFTYQHYFPIGLQTVITPRVTGGASNHPVYFEDDLFRFGGANSIRGYREEQFRSSGYIWSDIEVRRLLDDFSYLFAFTSIGVERSPKELGLFKSESNSNLLYSVGIGLSYRISLGSLKLSYALSPDDRLNNGKIHFGISNSF
jgi:translocation and assembly module TamA